MPATAGRVRMPHNNRVSTSHALKTSDIWSKTIGHDPYAGDGDGTRQDMASSQTEKARGLLELARHQNLTGGRSSGGAGDDFARKMFLGLKEGEKRSTNLTQGNVGTEVERALLEEDDSSSEDEYVQMPDAKIDGSEPIHGGKGSSSSSSESSDDESDKEERRRRRKRKEKKRSKKRSSSKSHRRKKKERKHKRSRKRDYSSDSESSDDSSRSGDRRKRKNQRHHERKSRKRDRDLDEDRSREKRRDRDRSSDRDEGKAKKSKRNDRD